MYKSWLIMTLNFLEISPELYRNRLALVLIRRRGLFKYHSIPDYYQVYIQIVTRYLLSQFLYHFPNKTSWCIRLGKYLTVTADIEYSAHQFAKF